jgi:hypothetical protein
MYRKDLPALVIFMFQAASTRADGISQTDNRSTFLEWRALKVSLMRWSAHVQVQVQITLHLKWSPGC